MTDYIISEEQLSELKPDVADGMYRSIKEMNQEKTIFRVLSHPLAKHDAAIRNATLQAFGTALVKEIEQCPDTWNRAPITVCQRILQSLRTIGAHCGTMEITGDEVGDIVDQAVEVALAKSRDEIRNQTLDELKKNLQTRFITSSNQWSKGRNSGLLECCNIIDESLRIPEVQK